MRMVPPAPNPHPHPTAWSSLTWNHQTLCQPGHPIPDPTPPRRLAPSPKVPAKEAMARPDLPHALAKAPFPQQPAPTSPAIIWAGLFFVLVTECSLGAAGQVYTGSLSTHPGPGMCSSQARGCLAMHRVCLAQMHEDVPSTHPGISIQHPCLGLGVPDDYVDLSRPGCLGAGLSLPHRPGTSSSNSHPHSDNGRGVT